MRTFVLLPVAAAALAAATIGCGLVPASLRGTTSEAEQAIAAVSPPSEKVETVTPPMIAVVRYRAEACGGDYVCRDDGAWEPVADASAAAWTLTSDGF
jgi:hypothetical protein